MPSLKPSVHPALKSKVVYKINCPSCDACYVGQTSRHLTTRVKEHQSGGPVSKHLKHCNAEITMANVEIITTTNKSITHLMTLEALLIKELKPIINMKDEYKRRVLTIIISFLFPYFFKTAQFSNPIKKIPPLTLVSFYSLFHSPPP